MFKIESDIPYVSNRGGRGRKPTAFPFAEMDVGDSFLIPCDPQDKKALDSWRRKLRVAKKHVGEGFDIRTAVQKDGLRVWCTA